MARQTQRAREATHFPAFDFAAPESAAPAKPIESTLAPFQALVQRLSEAFGPSGSEEPIRELVRQEIKELVDQVRVDSMGNLIAQRRGSGSNRKKVLLSAHLDEIGFMVTFIDGRGFARFGALGAINPLTLLGARCQFENGAIGIIGCEDKSGERVPELDKYFIDFGTSAEAAAVAVGDSATFARELVTHNAYWNGKALDDRIGCAVLIETLRQLKKSPYDISCVFTVQHQVGARGAGAAAFAIEPDFAVTVDVTSTGDFPGADAAPVSLGKGPVIKFKDAGMVTSASMRQTLLHAARETHIPYQVQVSSTSSGDAMPIQAARQGVPTGVLSIPLRYQHTPAELVHAQDVQDTIEILRAVLTKPM